MDRSEIAALFSKGRRFETVSLLAGVSLLSLAVFARSGSSMVFVLFPALLLVIFRLGSAGSAIGVFLMVTPAAYLTTRGTGPFSAAQAGALNHSIFLLQAFLGVSLVTIYAVSAALAERNRLLQELTEAYRVADSHAGQDHLTGLANRRTFDEQLKRAWKQAVREKGSLSLLMMDVDYFKLFNDRYGHLAGDECLRTVGSILAAAPLRGSDLAARFGGEEFAVLLPRAGTEGAFLIADRIRQALADRQVPHIANPASIATVSIGVATLRPTAEADEKLLIQRADMALYQAKKGGRNQVQAWEPAPE
jgi:diguanylate cyclase (GGDEF)-like protein